MKAQAIPDELFKESAESDALRLIEQRIKQAHLDAYNSFSYNESKDITPTVLKAVRTALSSSYEDITGDVLFTDQKTKIFGESYRPF